MSNIAYHVTEKVRHLSVWTRDGEYWQGHHTPICGAPAKGRLEWANYFADEAACEYAMRRPICRRCESVVDLLASEVLL